MAPVLDEKTRELVLIAVGVADNCLGWLELHVGKAREAGASREEIEEVVDLVRAVMHTRMKETREFVQQAWSMGESAGAE